jgi:hypothetical protein
LSRKCWHSSEKLSGRNTFALQFVVISSVCVSGVVEMVSGVVEMVSGVVVMVSGVVVEMVSGVVVEMVSGVVDIVFLLNVH